MMYPQRPAITGQYANSCFNTRGLIDPVVRSATTASVGTDFVLSA